MSRVTNTPKTANAIRGKDDVEEMAGNHRVHLFEPDVAGLAENHRRCQQAEPQDASAPVNALSAPASYPSHTPFPVSADYA